LLLGELSTLVVPLLGTIGVLVAAVRLRHRYRPAASSSAAEE
jgi:hypothetical protein